MDAQYIRSICLFVDKKIETPVKWTKRVHFTGVFFIFRVGLGIYIFTKAYIP